MCVPHTAEAGTLCQSSSFLVYTCMCMYICMCVWPAEIPRVEIPEEERRQVYAAGRRGRKDGGERKSGGRRKGSAEGEKNGVDKKGTVDGREAQKSGGKRGSDSTEGEKARGKGRAEGSTEGGNRGGGKPGVAEGEKRGGKITQSGEDSGEGGASKGGGSGERRRSDGRKGSGRRASGEVSPRGGRGRGSRSHPHRDQVAGRPALTAAEDTGLMVPDVTSPPPAGVSAIAELHPMPVDAPAADGATEVEEPPPEPAVTVSEDAVVEPVPEPVPEAAASPDLEPELQPEPESAPSGAAVENEKQAEETDQASAVEVLSEAAPALDSEPEAKLEESEASPVEGASPPTVVPEKENGGAGNMPNGASPPLSISVDVQPFVPSPTVKRPLAGAISALDVLVGQATDLRKSFEIKSHVMGTSGLRLSIFY